jgi:SAM-dependent methyltransferase
MSHGTIFKCFIIGLQKKTCENEVDIKFSIGYLDKTPIKLGTQFDLVFNRICWLYAWSDRSFAKVIYSLIKPGGVAYIDTAHSGQYKENLSMSSKIRRWMDDHIALKTRTSFSSAWSTG